MQIKLDWDSKMTLHKGTGLPHDDVKFCVGYCGNEPKELLKVLGRPLESQTRFAVAVNTFYPEIQGGYYVNRNIIGIVQECLEQMRIWVVITDIYSAEGILPTEARASLQEDENYVLVDTSQTQRGTLYLWHFGTGGGGAFYRDDLILDFILDSDLIEPFKACLQKDCIANKIGISEWRQ